LENEKVALLQRKSQAAVASAFLGWTIDAFDFFVLVFALSGIAEEFGVSIPKIALTLTASLAMRPVGALGFGLLADRYGRRPILMANILFYSIMEVASGFATSYTVFFALRLAYGIGMGGNWGVGASLALESVPASSRGIVSGLLQEGYAAGNLLAAGAYFIIFPHWGWRPLFIVGILPAMIAIFFCCQAEETNAWKETRSADGMAYQKALFGNSRLFLYLVLLMTMMTLISHGTQDMYPTYLQRRGFSVSSTALITAVSTVGAILGGLIGGHASNRFGRRRVMIAAALLAALSIPIWVIAPTKSLVMVGAFSMQFMVQAAWGVIPIHMNELSPGPLRGIFPGLAYQLGVVISSSVGYIEAILGDRFGYAASMGGLAAVVLLAGAIVIWMGPEAKDVPFSRTEA